MNAAEITTEIDYLTCDTIELCWATDAPGTAPEQPARHGAPGRLQRARETARRAWTTVARVWDRTWPALLGMLMGFSAAAALWCMFLLWWLNT